MGWVDNSGKHEGWIQPVFADGRVGSGTSSSDGQYVQPLPGEPGWTADGWAGEIRPYSEVTHLRMVCECGDWTGPTIAVADLSDEHVDRKWMEPTEAGEDVFLRPWREHIAPANALTNLADLADRARALDDEIAETVAAARSAGASWAQIGRELGMTKQGAQQRFGA